MVSLFKREIIGQKIEVVDASNKCSIGIKGVVVDETKHTLLVEDNKRIRKRLMKKTITFKIKSKEPVEISGKSILGRPEERIKKSR